MNSHLLSTKTDHILATLPVKAWEGGLMGCTVIISYNSDYIYMSHLWEEPGFMYDPKNDDDDGVSIFPHRLSARYPKHRLA